MNTQNLRNELLNLTILGVACGIIFFAFLGSSPFHDKGEPREALVVRDIVLNGNWLFPLKLEGQIPSKPPLFHWFGALASIIRGQMTEATVRFPSALFASLGVFLIYYFGRRLYDSDTGLWAALILATTVVYYSLGSEARVDMTLTFSVALPLVLFYLIYKEALQHEAWRYLFFLLAGAGVTAKGPVSLVLCALVITLFLAAKGRRDVLLRFLRHRGIIVGIVACFAWYGTALYMGGKELLGLQFMKENLARFFFYGEGGTGHQKPIYYFLPYLFTLGLPWTIFLPIVIWQFFKRRMFADDRSLFLGIWIAVVFIFFSLSAGKRPPYILPLYPALALLTAATLWQKDENAKVPAAILRPVGVLAIAVGLIMAIVLAGYVVSGDLLWILNGFHLPLKENAANELAIIIETLNQRIWMVPALLLVAAGLSLLSGWNVLRGDVRRSVMNVALFSLVGIVAVQGIVSPALAAAQSYKEFVQAAKQSILGQETLTIFAKGLDVSSLVFYGGKNVKILHTDYEGLRRYFEQSKDYVVMGEAEWKEFREVYLPVPVIIHGRGSGPDGDDPLVLVRPSPPPLP